MSSTPLTATANQLTEQIEQARSLSDRAAVARAHRLTYRAAAIARQLDAARVQLLSIGPSALDSAVAFVAAGSAQLAAIRAEVERVELGIDAMADDRIDAADVLAWIESHGIRLARWQRRAIESLLPA